MDNVDVPEIGSETIRQSLVLTYTSYTASKGVGP